MFRHVEGVTRVRCNMPIELEFQVFGWVEIEVKATSVLMEHWLGKSQHKAFEKVMRNSF